MFVYTLLTSIDAMPQEACETRHIFQHFINWNRNKMDHHYILHLVMINDTQDVMYISYIPFLKSFNHVVLLFTTLSPMKSIILP